MHYGKNKNGVKAIIPPILSHTVKLCHKGRIIFEQGRHRSVTEE